MTAHMNWFSRLRGTAVLNSAPQFDSARAQMVARQIRSRGVSSSRVLDAMLAVPRHEFVPAANLAEAYDDKPISIGPAQTISQPYIVAAMAEALELAASDRVLEIGCGSGYQAAILALLAAHVVSVECVPSLAAAARARLAHLGCSNVQIEIGDGSLGWSDAASYDAIIVSAAAPALPAPLVDQLAPNGRLIAPIGDSGEQQLVLYRKEENRLIERTLFPCRFVPLVGAYGWHAAENGDFRR